MSGDNLLSSLVSASCMANYSYFGRAGFTEVQERSTGRKTRWVPRNDLSYAVTDH